MSFELVAETVGHQGDVRSLCSLPGVSANEAILISGGRDRVVNVWKARADGKVFDQTKQIFDHEHWVSALVALPDGNGFISASQDSIIRRFDNNGNLLGLAKGHTGPVTSLSLDLKGNLISGSWDGSAKVWKLHEDGTSSCVQTLPGHENGVCVLALPNGTIATGSAGMQSGNSVIGYQVRLWKDGKEIKSMKDHSSAVRSLALSPDAESFYSSSNDGTVRQYSLDGKLLATLQNPLGANGSPGFCFSVTTNSNGEVLTGNDDCCVRVWAAGSLIEEIAHPCTVWSVHVLPNGDIATAGADGLIRVFTRDNSRKAPESVREYYVTETQKTLEEIAKKQSGGNSIDVSKLKQIEYAPPGSKEGEIKMFNKSGKAFVYQWSGTSQTWVEVGEAMGSADGGGEIDGVHFDKVLPIELEDPASGSLRKLEIGINNGDNPFVVAQAFAAKYGLPESHVNDIVNYINQNRGNVGPTIDMSGGQSASAMEVDEGPKTTQFPLLHVTGFAFQKAPWDKISDKIVDDFNGKVEADLKLTLKDLDTLESLIQILKNESRYHASSIAKYHTNIFIKMLKWNAEFLFPVLDLSRMTLCHPMGAEAFGPELTKVLLETAIGNASKTGAKLAVALTGARVLANLFRHSKGVDYALEILLSDSGVKTIAGPLKRIGAFDNKSVRSALATVYLNIANAAFHKQVQSANMDTLLDIVSDGAVELVTITSKHGEDESSRRALAAIGCILRLKPTTKVSGLEKVLKAAEASSKTENLSICVKELRAEMK
mmetsp:Transcript_16847/g.19110  ORF Transcript_16847/g.19110 Transcript_16847/m.19110 type:complete len:770 (+) Transcript_16847:87-2396(+)